MTTSAEVSCAAGEQFRSAAGFAFEDATQRRLRYHLIRLTVVGLTQDDVQDLGELARLAFDDADLTEQANKIKQRANASPLAFAIADILGQAGSVLGGRISNKMLMLGSVLGAYTAVATAGSGAGELAETTAAIQGAIGGAVALSTSSVILDNIKQESADEYLRMDE
jgi:hypothetical protein